MRVTDTLLMELNIDIENKEVFKKILRYGEELKKVSLDAIDSEYRRKISRLEQDKDDLEQKLLVGCPPDEVLKKKQERKQKKLDKVGAKCEDLQAKICSDIMHKLFRHDQMPKDEVFIFMDGIEEKIQKLIQLNIEYHDLEYKDYRASFVLKEIEDLIGRTIDYDD
jgi:hypothetical protein